MIDELADEIGREARLMGRNGESQAKDELVVRERGIEVPLLLAAVGEAGAARAHVVQLGGPPLEVRRDRLVGPVARVGVVEDERPVIDLVVVQEPQIAPDELLETDLVGVEGLRGHLAQLGLDAVWGSRHREVNGGGDDAPVVIAVLGERQTVTRVHRGSGGCGNGGAGRGLLLADRVGGAVAGLALRVHRAGARVGLEGRGGGGRLADVARVADLAGGAGGRGVALVARCRVGRRGCEVDETENHQGSQNHQNVALHVRTSIPWYEGNVQNGCACRQESVSPETRVATGRLCESQ